MSDEPKIALFCIKIGAFDNVTAVSTKEPSSALCMLEIVVLPKLWRY